MCAFFVTPVIFVSLAPVTTDHGCVPVFGSGALVSVSNSNVGSIVGAISITALVVTLVLSVIVTTDRSKVSDRLDGFTISRVLSLALMGCVTGRSGKVSSGSVLSVFFFFAFRQCFGQCPSSLVRLWLLVLLLIESSSFFILGFSSSVLMVTDPTTLLFLISSMVSCADSRVSEGPVPGNGL